MKNLWCVMGALLLSWSATAQSTLPPLEITHATGNLYVYTSFGRYKDQFVPANAMYAVTTRGIVLFDTPWDSAYFQPLLDSLQARYHKPVLMCFSTHWHEDRTAGLNYYGRKGIETFATRQTDSLCILHHKPRAANLIADDTVFAVGGSTFHIFYGGPGHSFDNIVVWFPREKLLYGGCLIKSSAAKDLGNTEDAFPKQWAGTIERILHKFGAPAMTVAGHGPWRDNHSIQHTLSLVARYNKEHD